MTATEASADPPLLLFDGECNLCSSWVQFVLKREAGNEVKFAALQSDGGRSALEAQGMPSDQLDTIVFIERGKAYVRSTAVLRLTAYLRAPWRWAVVFLWTPAFLRDFFYRLIARNRYRLFGKTDQCFVPSEATRCRFLN